ncbi:MAG: hypothetical protein JNM43_11110 [Planctomycetaceae bacterium]|nr:hypothetical protein [Planctomycetaceae bacterium]
MAYPIQTGNEAGLSEQRISILTMLACELTPQNPMTETEISLRSGSRLL